MASLDPEAQCLGKLELGRYVVLISEWRSGRSEGAPRCLVSLCT